MVFELAKGSVHEAGEDAVFKVEYMCGEGAKTGGEDTEEDEARRLGVEAIVYGIYER